MFDEYRTLFPSCERYLYLNHAGVAPTSTRVKAAALSWIEDLLQYGIAHEDQWEKQAERIRAQAARLIGAEAEQIAFVRNTSHGLGLVAEGIDWQPGDEVALCSEVEYPSNIYPWQHLRHRGVVLRDFPATRGGVEPDALRAVLCDKTRLVTVSSVQYASGHRTDLEAIGALCREHDALLCVDGIQSVGAAEIDVAAAGISFLAADSHKWMLGLGGSGFLYVAPEALAQLRPVLVGWKSTTEAWNFDRAHFELRKDAAKLEEGSPAYTGIYGLGAAIDLLLEVGLDRIAGRIEALLDRLEVGLLELGCQVSPPAGARAGILTFLPPSGDAQTLVDRLQARQVQLSCRRERIRISPHFYSSDEEIERFIALVQSCLD